MTDKSTPRPWKATPFSSVVGCPITAQPDPTRNTVIVAGVRGAMAQDPEGYRSEVEANAALIVTAVNAHDEMVNALNECHRIFASPDFTDRHGMANCIALILAKMETTP